MSLKLATENKTPMKAKMQASEETYFNDDDQRKRIMYYDLRVCTWNIRTPIATVAEILIKCGADITAIQEMR